MKLSEFSDRELTLTKSAQLRHPESHTVIGAYAYDDQHSRAIVLPRTRSEHYFRKYEGYAISVSVLDEALGRGVPRVYIIEKESDEVQTVHEYSIASFCSGTLIAYSPEENTSIEGERAIEQAPDGAYPDKQRIAPDTEILRSWDPTEVTVQ